MTDDQTAEQLAAMPRTRELIGRSGATFANSFVSFPLCCPSRATFLTGQYAHNHKVLDNAGPIGGFDRLRTDETLPVWLQRAGYATAQIGKFMNEYETSPVGVPPGWSEWHGEKSFNRYYGYRLLEEGELVTYGDPGEDPADPERPETYSTDVYTAKAAEYIGRRAPALDPFFLWLSYNAPHSGRPEAPPERVDSCRGHAKPAARHRGAFATARLPRPPSLNEADVADKPEAVASRPPLTAAQLAEIERGYRCEREALLAVDEGIEAVVAALAASGELERTYVIFTSDNGFHHGEHRIAFGKHTPYEEALRVPLLVRGPGISPGTRVRELVGNVDLAPTILDAAGARAGLPQDGRSLLPFAERPRRLRGREVLIDTNHYRGIRNARYSYVERRREGGTGRELYDLDRDPHQLESLAGDRDHRRVQRALADRVDTLKRCVGESCEQPPDVVLRGGRGRGCAGGFARFRIGGGDVTRLVRVEFRAGSVTRTDTRKPYRFRLPLGDSQPTHSRVRAELALLDGRLATRSRRARC